MGKFFTKTKHRLGEAALFTRVRNRNKNIDIMVNSLIRVDIGTWVKANESLDAWGRFLKTKDGKEIYDKMQRIDAALGNLIRQGIFDKPTIDKVIADIIYQEQREKQREEREKERAVVESEEAARRADVILFLENRLQGMKAGYVRFNGELYGEGTCKVWGNFGTPVKPCV